jgi:hypothetical protein
MGLTIAAHAAMFVGQSLLDVYVDKDKLACPKEMLCTSTDCSGQDEGKKVTAMSTICKKVGMNISKL